MAKFALGQALIEAVEELRRAPGKWSPFRAASGDGNSPVNRELEKSDVRDNTTQKMWLNVKWLNHAIADSNRHRLR